LLGAQVAMFLHPVIGMETVKTTLEYIEAQGQVSWIFGVS
jgi:hypothetical protein